MKIIIQSIKNYFKSKKDRGLEPVFFEKIGDQKKWVVGIVVICVCKWV